MDLMYCSYLDYIVRTLGRDAGSLIDIGTAQCPYLEWFDWIPNRTSFDMVQPYQSKTVTGIQGDFLDHDFGSASYDIVTCLQVLEHIPEPVEFSRKLLSLGKTIIVSVPYNWPKSAADDHIHDPIDYEKLTQWMGREANYHIVVQEPFRGKVGKRLIAIYDEDQSAGYGRKQFKKRIRRNRFVIGG
ncbi:class I SAM-dependent methyltransferase [Roseobacter sp. SK209-2-6]|uniref:class I SAM-dependent methyltransferase n=1 Tax=Roseobacter sp. SK209-2-6 TaxID=388739 RepID=UPI001E5E7856|nr:methyltransferase domain-containing protein [Roseobacter sp. SK209-2-6]